MDPRGKVEYEWDPVDHPPPHFPPSPLSDKPQQTPQNFDNRSSAARPSSEPGQQHRQDPSRVGRNSTAAMNGAPVQNYSHLYNNNWDYPTSPPPKAKSDYGEPGPEVQSLHDTTKSRLADEHRHRPQSFAQGQYDEKQPGARQWERRRLTKYYPRDNSDSGSYPSDKTVHPGQRLSHYDQQRGDRRLPRKESQKRGTPPQVPPQPVQKKNGIQLDEIITPLRLGILLGCFDIIGGSLSVWMTNKRFGKAAQQQQQQSQQQQQAAAGGNPSSRSEKRRPSRRPRHEERCDDKRPLGYDSETDSSEDEERRRRTEDHVREQLRLGYGQRRGRRRGGRR